MQTTIFTKIIERKLPAFIVAEDNHHIAFLDKNPVVMGHTLVIPKKATDYFFDLPDNALKDLICFAKRVAKGIEKVVPCLRIGIKVHGLEVPHAHIHILPILDGEAPSSAKKGEVATMEAMSKAIGNAINLF